MSLSPTCYYCSAIAAVDPSYPVMQASVDVGSPMPRCLRHWQYACDQCQRSVHFMSAAACPTTGRLFCAACAVGVRIVAARFWCWDYYFLYRSPWSQEWCPSMDRWEFDQRCRHSSLASLPRSKGRPVNTRELYQFRRDTVAEAAIRAVWDANSAAWDASIQDEGDDFRRHRTDDAFIRMIGPVEGMRVLDIGCGNGYFARRMARLGADVDAVDLSPKMVRLARTRKDSGNRRVKYRVASATDLKVFADGIFDVAVSNFVLMSIADAPTALREAHRVLRSHGSLAIALTHPVFVHPSARKPYVSDSPRLEEAFGALASIYRDRGVAQIDTWPGFEPTPHFHRTLSDYWELFRSAGFVVDHFEEPGLALEPAQQSGQVAIGAHLQACLYLLRKTA